VRKAWQNANLAVKSGKTWTNPFLSLPSSNPKRLAEIKAGAGKEISHLQKRFPISSSHVFFK
jgi:hypothetical protein